MIEWIWVIGAGVLRSFGGWLNNSLEDGEINKFEYAQLASTLLRIILLGVGLHFGLDSFGINVDALGTAASAFVLDFILRIWK